MQPQAPTATIGSGGTARGVLLDLDTVVIEARPDRARPDIHLRPGTYEGLRRLRELADRVVIVVHPQPPGSSGPATGPGPESWLPEVLAKLEPEFSDIIFVSCPHGAAQCECARPGSELVAIAVQQAGLDPHASWHISGDQESVQVGRGGGLRTITIGPMTEGHLSAVHRPDHEARDLLDAANWILVEELAV